ncbi:class I SAM-dependent methyltransferase [Falsiroseomonas sp. HC035]|uniref:class I SAM-dependent methyltransferase n=1 Tax=Falsiroseomonas sp. HC035 TaxID=3390999 RepID=UPI003D319EBA
MAALVSNVVPEADLAATLDGSVPLAPAPQRAPPADRQEMPDVETSSERYTLRFRGASGAYLLSVQEAGIIKLLDNGAVLPGRMVLDVGGGHMQLAGPLTRRGAKVTVFGSEAACGRRWSASALAGQVQFLAGSLLSMPMADQQFEVVVCIRLLSHMEDWRALVAELCRVARHSIVIDYPTLASLNALSLFAFPLKRAIETNTRTYRSFRDREVEEAFAQYGFLPVASYRQFVLPMAAHRLLGRVGLLRWVEAGLRAIGVTQLIGNPVLLRLDRVKT